MNIELSVRSLIFALNLRSWDPIHGMRVISNFYSKVKHEMNHEEMKELALQMNALSNNVNNYFHRNIYQLLVYILSGYDEKYAPKKFDPILNYTLSDKDLDERLLKFNVLVGKGEFE